MLDPAKIHKYHEIMNKLERYDMRLTYSIHWFIVSFEDRTLHKSQSLDDLELWSGHWCRRIQDVRDNARRKNA